MRKRRLNWNSDRVSLQDLRGLNLLGCTSLFRLSRLSFHKIDDILSCYSIIGASTHNIIDIKAILLSKSSYSWSGLDFSYGLTFHMVDDIFLGDSSTFASAYNGRQVNIVSVGKVPHAYTSGDNYQKFDNLPGPCETSSFFSTGQSTSSSLLDEEDEEP